MKPIRAVSVLPTLFTLGNLVCGFFAIVVAARVDKPSVEQVLGEDDPTNCMIAAALIFLAMAFDALDGQLARLSRSTSNFGAQLDSLCDLVTFGVAPAFLLVKMCPMFTLGHENAVWIIAATFAVCVALRLARFNVETDEADDHAGFSGLPSPAGGAAVASFAFMFFALRREESTLIYGEWIDGTMQRVLPVFALLVAALMVSRLPYPHVANHLVRGQKSFRHLVALVFAVGVVMLVRGYAVPLVCAAFVFTGPLRYLWCDVLQRGPQERPGY